MNDFVTKMIGKINVKLFYLLLSMILYIACFQFYAFYTFEPFDTNYICENPMGDGYKYSLDEYCDEYGTYSAVDPFMIFVLGLSFFFLVIFSPFTMMMWYANPLLFYSWYAIFRNKKRASLVTSGIAFCLSLSFLLVDEVPAGSGMADADVEHIGLGYWIWLASMASALLASWFIVPKAPDIEENENIEDIAAEDMP